MKVSHQTKTINWIDVSLILAFISLLGGITITKIADYDFWWHLNLGREIFAQKTPFILDKFSYTFQGMPQFNGEWLADLILYLSYISGEWFGVAFLKFALISLTSFLLARAMLHLQENSSKNLIAILLTLVVYIFAIRFRLFIRPFLFSYVFFASFLVILFKYERERKSTILWFIPLLELLWANCSKGLFFGPTLVGIMAISDLLSGRKDKKLWLCFLATFVVSLINPEGLKPYGFIFQLLSDQRTTSLVGEHQSLSPGLLWGGSWYYFIGFQLLFFGGITSLTLFKQSKNRFVTILFILFSIPPFFMVRMIDFFSISFAFS